MIKINKRNILILSILILFIILFFNHNKKIEETINSNVEEKEIIKSSNLLENVKYTAKDNKGNTYEINAEIGEIDLNNSSVIFLTNITGLIILTDTSLIKITSKFGKYNTNNYETIFSKDVIITYLDNKITGDYLDLSLIRNSMIISKNAIYTNPQNIIKADVIEMNIKTKDTKIFMHQDSKKVNIKSLN